jgi:hypothetical protein
LKANRPKEGNVSISSMAAAAMARRTDSAIAATGPDLAAIAAAVVPQSVLLPLPPPQPGLRQRVVAAPALPGQALRGPVPPAQPTGRVLPLPPAQPGGAAAPVAAPAAGGPTSAVSAALQVITTYIPTEIITLYVAVLAALRDKTNTLAAASALRAFWFFLAVTPLVVWLVYAARVRSAKPARPLPVHPYAWPLWEMFAAATAFTAWAAALPDSPLMGAGVSPALGGILVLVASTLLGLAAPVFQRSLKA